MAHQPAVDLVLHAGDLSYADCKQVRLLLSSIADALLPFRLILEPKAKPRALPAS